MPAQMMYLNNAVTIPNPVNGSRIIIGNIEETDDIYVKLECLEFDEATKNSTHMTGGPAYTGRMVWTEKCSQIFPNTFRTIVRMKRDYEWDDTYIRFIKMCLSSNVNNYNQFIKFVGGFKIFETTLPKGVKVILDEDASYPHEIVDVTPTHYILRDYYDTTSTTEVPKGDLEEIAYKKWQVDFRNAWHEYF